MWSLASWSCSLVSLSELYSIFGITGQKLKGLHVFLNSQFIQSRSFFHCFTLDYATMDIDVCVIMCFSIS